MALEQGTEAVPSSSVLPANATNGNLLLSHLRNSIDKLAVETPGYNFVIGGDFHHLEASEITKNTHCTLIKTSGTRGKKCLDEVFVPNTDLIDQAETIKTSFNTDHLAIILQPMKPLKAEQRQKRSGTIAFRSDKGCTYR